MRKAKRYADGGTTLVLGNQPAQMDPTLSTNAGAAGSYPFAGSGGGGAGSSNTTTTNVSVGQQPGGGEPPLFRKGGVVRVRGGGCEQRGKTRGRMV